MEEEKTEEGVCVEGARKEIAGDGPRAVCATGFLQ